MNKSNSPSILDNMSKYIDKLSIRYSITNIVLIIALSYILANIISIFKININY